MKKLLLTLCVLFLFIGSVFAATGTRSISPPTFYYVQDSGWRATITIAWTGSTDDGTVPTIFVPISADGLNGWYLYMIEVDPSSATPSSGYSFTLVDSHGLDLCGGLLSSLSSTVTQIFCIGTAIPGFPVMVEDPTATWTNNSDTSSGGTLILTFTSN